MLGKQGFGLKKFGVKLPGIGTIASGAEGLLFLTGRNTGRNTGHDTGLIGLLRRIDEGCLIGCLIGIFC